MADVREAEWVLRLPEAAWLAAAVGAAACIISLMLPVPAALRRSIVNYQQELARSGKKPLWQRFYLDVVLLLVGLILLWRLQIFGSLIGGSSAEPRVDWLLLAAPLALLLGAATILLRVFPALLNGLAAIASRGPGFPALLAFIQPARNPSHITRLVLLLTLAMALGLFSTGLDATLDRNDVDSAIYSTGSDFRIINPGLDVLEAVESSESVADLSLGYRGNGRLEQRIQNSFPEFEVLAIEPESFVAVSSFRDDFAASSVPEMIKRMTSFQPEQLPTQQLPGEPGEFGLWLWIHEEDLGNLNSIDFDAKFVTAQNNHFNIHLNIPIFDSTPEGNWHYYSGLIPNLAASEYPIEFHSLWIRSRSPFFFPSAPLGIDDITVADRLTAEVTVLNSFESSDMLLISEGAPLQTAIVETKPSQSGEGRLDVSFPNAGMRSFRWHGMNLAGTLPAPLIPALVSQEFQALTSVVVGDQIGVRVDTVLVTVEIVGIVDFFPTLYQEQDAGFIVTLSEPVLAQINLSNPESTLANELFLAATESGLTTGALAEENPGLLTGRSQILEADTIRKNIKADPLALGLRSVTLFGYILTSVLSLAGFISHFYMSARQRANAYGVLRAIGLSPSQLYGSLILEQSSLIFAGLVLGTGLGLLMNWLTLTQLPILLGGRPPAPPFVASTDWLAVGQIYLTLTIAFLISLAMAVYLLWRMQIHRVLRVGEEQ